MLLCLNGFKYGFKYLYVEIYDIMAQKALLIMTFSCSKFFTVKETLL